MSGQIYGRRPETLRTRSFDMSLLRDLVPILRRPTGADDRARAALHLIDWLGCAFAGAVEPAGVLLRADAAAEGDGLASVIGGGERSAAAAAFANGGLGNVLEMDDVHRAAILHPGPVTIPAALAMAQERGASGAALLDAVVIGYEAVIRVGRSLGPAHYALWHNTASAGPFGSAAACARLLDLGGEATVWALGNAGTQVSGPWQCRNEPVMSKQLHTARAAHAGLKAARLAALGFSGPAFMLEGPQGLYAATAPDAEPARVIADPDGPFLLHETSFKPWPACRHAHAAIDAALLARGRIADRPIAAVEIRTYADAATFCDRPSPRTPHEAKFSLQHAVAATLIEGPPSLALFEPDAIARADIAALRARGAVVVAPVFAYPYPARYGSGLHVTLGDGEMIETNVPDALGDPENPLADERIVAKALALLDHADVPGSDARALVDAASALVDAPDLGDLANAMARCGAHLPRFDGAGVRHAA